MQRRTLFQSLFTWMLLRRSTVWAQPPIFPGKHESALNELAATVLPESLGRVGTDAIAMQFVRWVKQYRAGAEMQTGYGFTRIRYKPTSPASRYLEQLDQLASGALTGSSVLERRARIAEVLQAANVKDLAFVPDGAHVASDLMAFYFQSTEANDSAYGAKIGKDKCRGLNDSSSMPAAVKQDGISAPV